VELTIDEITTLVFQHSRLAIQARKLADEHQRLSDVYLEVGKRFNREHEEKESKMKLRNILSGILTLVLMLVLVGSLSVTRAQGEPEATAAVTASVNGNPVEATLEPTGGTDTTTSENNTLRITLEAVKDYALIIAVVLLAFKTSGLIPQETVDKVLARGFDLAKGLADTTPTPIDNQLLEIAKPVVLKWVQDELARQGSELKNVSINLTAPTSAVPPMTKMDFTVTGQS